MSCSEVMAIFAELLFDGAVVYTAKWRNRKQQTNRQNNTTGSGVAQRLDRLPTYGPQNKRPPACSCQGDHIKLVNEGSIPLLAF
jgi:hypothetical protein